MMHVFIASSFLFDDVSHLRGVTFRFIKDFSYAEQNQMNPDPPLGSLYLF